MEKAVGLLSPEPRVVTKADPRLRLLIELEPRHEAFFSNLADAFSREPALSLKLTSAPGEFWHDVFVPSGLPWGSIKESLLWHFVVVAASWALMQSWATRPRPHVNQTYRTSKALYYSPSKTFPNARSRPPLADVHKTRTRNASATRTTKAMPVAAENRGTPKLVVPPDLKMAVGTRAPSLAANPAMPAVPLSATERANQALAGLNSVVAPPPDVSGGKSKTLGGLQAGIVAPPVDAKGIAGDRTLRGPGSANVIAPPPALQGASRGLGSLGAGTTQVVAPPPALQGQNLRAGAGAGPRGLAPGGAVVPPPPSVEHAGRGGAVSGPGVAVVPPPPSMQGAGIGGGNGRGPSSNGVGAAVVPPPPSVQSGSGGGLFATLSSWFSNTPSKVVPPPPGLQGEGGGAGGSAGRVGSLSGGGSDVVPPPPSVQGGGNGRGRVTSLRSGGSAVVPPPPSVQGAGGGSGAHSGLGNSLSGGGAGVVPPPPTLSGSGSGSGRGTGARGGGGGSLSAGGMEVVPPPPSISGGDNGAGSGTSGVGNRLGSLAGGGGSVVPPPPSPSGSGGGAGGSRLGSLGTGNAVGPPPTVGGGGGVGGSSRESVGAPGGGGSPAPTGAGSVSTGPLEQMDPLPDVPESTQTAPPLPDNAAPPGEEVPLRLIQVPGAASKTSFFSNFEVVLAERNITPTKKEIIKLVYISLPYQKRLAEYDWNTTRIYKLRVIQDPSCDESLMQMMFPEGNEQLDAETQDQANRLASEVSDKNMKLRCYRTTADDFQRAVTHR